jgi:hypothetical protein
LPWAAAQTPHHAIQPSLRIAIERANRFAICVSNCKRDILLCLFLQVVNEIENRRCAACLEGKKGGLNPIRTFPPLVPGAVRQAPGTFTPGFVLLALFAIICFVVLIKSASKPDTG